MRRFFRVGREEDYSQTHFLTAKCNRLTHEKGEYGIFWTRPDEGLCYVNCNVICVEIMC